MSTLFIRGPARISGSLSLPGDKSISHRALMLGAAAAGRTTVRGLAPGADVASTIACLERYGVRLEPDGGVVTIHSRGIDEWTEPEGILDCRNSGTTMRVLAGLAARRPFESVFDGDDSLRRRPMDRVAIPLRILGARVETRDGCPPLWVQGGALRGGYVETGVASAQVKTAVMLAALGAEGTSAVVEPVVTRDHTERMLESLGVEIAQSITEDGHRIDIVPTPTPPFDLAVPGDVSSSAFLVAAAVLSGKVHIDGVGLNPTRTGYLDVLRMMGASVRWETREDRMNEPVGTIDAEISQMRGVTLDETVIPQILDELPAIAVVATQAHGETVVRNARELRVKESDRITTLVEGLRAFGADVDELDDGLVVRGPVVLEGATVRSAGDHRIAMAFAVAGIIAKGDTRVEDFESADVSWPGFDGVLATLGAEVELT
jgi:3-phosphoshikimate 1-carboxyvinyltransferase